MPVRSYKLTSINLVSSRKYTKRQKIEPKHNDIGHNFYNKYSYSQSIENIVTGTFARMTCLEIWFHAHSIGVASNYS